MRQLDLHDRGNVDTLTSGAFIGAGLVQAAITVALYVWGSTVAARRRTRFWWWARWLPILALILATAGVIGNVVQLVAAFDAVGLLAPELRPRSSPKRSPERCAGPW